MTEQKKEKDFELKFLSDRPTAEDELGVHRVIADNLKRLIVEGLPKPFVIGLYGAWGSGKSSIVEMLQVSSDRTFKMIVVDAWRTDKENFLRQFIKKMACKFLREDDAKRVCNKVNFKTSEQESAWIPGKWAKRTFTIFLFLATIFVLGTIGTWWNIHKDPQFKDFPLKEIGGFVFLILTAIAFQWLLPKYSQKIDTRTEEITIEDPAWFRDVYFGEILANASGVCVCVVIDNLDRVPTEDAIAIIKFIKTFVVDIEDEKIAPNKTKVTFLIPCDDRELIERMKDGSIATPTEFLRKFINVSIRIPPLLEQDNTNYIRGLIKRTGLSAESHIIENLAFIVSRACSNNPRKPKSILNHFIARYNLAKSFPQCWEIVRKRPDWFAVYCILESESFGFHVADNLEPSKRMSENSGLEISGLGEGFTGSIRPIIDEISVEAWRTFQFLKTPNVHHLIPHFNELTELSLERNREKFNVVFFKLLPEHPYLLNILWSERQDNPSRMAFAESILWAYESEQNFKIPPTILNGIAIMIQSHVTGWTHLPPASTYQLVVKPRPACLSSILGSFNTSNYDASETSLAFLHRTLSLIACDFYETSSYQKEISVILENRAKTDLELTSFGLKYPKYQSKSVFQSSLTHLLKGERKVQPKTIVGYLQELSTFNEAFCEECLTSAQQTMLECFGHFRSLIDRTTVFEFSYELLAGMGKKSFSGGGIHQKHFFTTFSDLFGYCHTDNFWEGAYFIVSSGIELSLSQTDSDTREAVLDKSENLVPEFLLLAPTNLVEKVLEKYIVYFQSNHRDAILQLIGRSPQLVKRLLRDFPHMRSDIIVNVVSSYPDWLVDITLAFKNDVAVIEEIGPLLIEHGGNIPDNILYGVIGRLNCVSPKFTKALQNHFDKRIGLSNVNTIDELQTILRAMDLASYKLTESQEAALRKIKDSIPIEQLSKAQQSLFRKFFAEPATENL